MIVRAKGLKKMPIDRDPTRRRARWALDVYDWVIKHRNGTKHTNSDSLSRRPTQSDTTPQPTSDLSVFLNAFIHIKAASLRQI